jgi:hypothetical protein
MRKLLCEKLKISRQKATLTHPAVHGILDHFFAFLHFILFFFIHFSFFVDVCGCDLMM